MTRLGRLSVAAFAVIALSTGLARAEDLVVASAGPISGQQAAFGEQLLKGAQMAVTDINGKGGILGRKLVLTIGDDACDPKQAVAVANQLAGRKVALVVGHYCSGSSIPASSVYADHDMIQITPASTNPALTEDAAKNGWDTVFRTCGRDDEQGKVAGNYLVRLYKDKKVAIIDDRSTYGKGLADETRKAMNAGGLKEALDEEITAGDKDFTALVSRLKQNRIEAVYFGGYHPEAGLLVRQAQDQGYKIHLLGGDALATEEFSKIAGTSGDGTMFTFAPDPRKNPASRAVLDEFTKAGYDPEGYTLFSYAAFQIYAAAASQAKSTKSDDVAKVMKSGIKFDTVVGPISYDHKGDVQQPTYVFYRFAGGKYDQVM